ncbi:DUF4367 domain-containing protein [Fredinandcohnia sp. 179-A 10B2 NHS]|uniref:DUF4367 domain-containing protein n=1 Tax=Fredinandcohnia sp. 179-A 10B2 NHS TaxID=3235176 RepID=UPI0039A286AA
MSVSEVNEKVVFSVLTPDQIPEDWTLEIKTYPSEETEHYSHFRLHYMNSNDTKLMVGIEQSPRRLLYDDVRRSLNAEQIDINESQGYFSKWGNSSDDKGEITGGLLCWKQEGTYIVMDSTEIPKKLMIEIAKSMKVVK